MTVFRDKQLTDITSIKCLWSNFFW